MDISGMHWNAEVETYDIGVIGDEIISISPMLFNHRVTIGQNDEYRYGYDHGWCYPNLAAALAAVNVWDPATEPEPVGYIKKATPGQRRVPVVEQVA